MATPIPCVEEHDKVVKYLEASEATIKSIWDQLKIGNLQKEDHVSLIHLLRDEIDHILATRMPIVTAPMHPSNIDAKGDPGYGIDHIFDHFIDE
ncbi:hypothetical protein FQN52_001261 [Onygenales sp. PD_12]|nr:hypothetical protein FQN52_001261 [Onygenales sp. PD_12]